jgi:hypothetical protein
MHPGAEGALGFVGNEPWLVDTISQYLLAPLTDDQLKLGEVETPL